MTNDQIVQAAHHSHDDRFGYANRTQSLRSTMQLAADQEDWDSFRQLRNILRELESSPFAA